MVGRAGEIGVGELGENIGEGFFLAFDRRWELRKRHCFRGGAVGAIAVARFFVIGRRIREMTDHCSADIGNILKKFERRAHVFLRTPVGLGRIELREKVLAVIVFLDGLFEEAFDDHSDN